MARTVAVVFVVAAAVSSFLGRPVAAAAAAPSRQACTVIVAEMRRQGATEAVAVRFGRIAWRESGCVAQRVSDRDDLSWSRFGLNFRGAMPAYWRRVCGVSDYRATRVLGTDVRCALAAYRHVGWRPWR